MIRWEAINHLLHSQSRNNLVYPSYDGYGIANLGPAILEKYGVPTSLGTRLGYPLDTSRKITLLFIVDGLGFDHFLRYHPLNPFLKSLAQHGQIVPLTSVFPSTTAAALTTLHTGLSPASHAIPEWNVYFEELHTVIQTLPFSTTDNPERDSLLARGGTPQMLYDGPTIYQQLSDYKTPAYIFTYQEYNNSTYTKQISQGAIRISFANGHDLMDKLLNTLTSLTEPAYICVYWSAIDSTAHAFGPDSAEHRLAINGFDQLVREQFLAKLPLEVAKNVEFLLTADHGHIPFEESAIRWLNEYPEIWEELALPPTGSPHDCFLYTKPGRQETVLAALHNRLGSTAEIYTQEQILKRQIFGLEEASSLLKRRIGDIQVIPQTGLPLWYRLDPTTSLDLKGMHGGLSQAEMLVPFAMAPLEVLVTA